MKRDMDLIRRIALATAELPPDDVLTELDGVDAATFAMHVTWMQEGGLVAAVVPDSMHSSDEAHVFRLTWAGCDFADAVKDDTLWSKAKIKVLKPSASWTFGVLRDWLTAEISQGLPTLRG